MKVWITKYALTKGIFAEEVDACFHISPKMVADRGRNTTCYTTCYHKPDWHENLSDAIAQAETMRARKIKSLEKQIAKLKAMRFDLEVKP